MKILAVDDEQLVLNHLLNTIKSVQPDADIYQFTSTSQALEFASSNQIDVAFIDIKMPKMNGLEFAKRLKKINHTINIIFCTGYSEYAKEAFNIHASGYILKPATATQVKKELDELRYPIAMPEDHIRAVCFGNFDFYVDNKPVSFKRSLSKELLAYLIYQHGTGITKRQASSIIFPNEAYTKQNQDYLNKIVRDLKLSLKEVKADDVLILKHNYYAVDTSKFSCDLYEFERGDVKALNSFHGDFMSQYNWGEEFLSDLIGRTI